MRKNTSIDSIKKNVLRDHYPFIKDYSQQTRKDIISNTESGLNKMKQYKNIAGELAVRYPRLFSYVVNRDEAYKLGITQAKLLSEISTQLGGGKDSNSNANVNYARERIEEIKKIIQRLNTLDLSNIQKTAVDIMKQLEDLELELEKSISDENTGIGARINPDTILSNLQTLKSTLEKSASGTYTKSDVIADIAVPVPQFDFNIDTVEFGGILLNMSQSYSNIFNFGADTNKFIKNIMGIVINGSIEQIREYINTIKQQKYVNNEFKAAIIRIVEESIAKYSPSSVSVSVSVSVSSGSSGPSLSEIRSSIIKKMNDLITRVLFYEGNKGDVSDLNRDKVFQINNEEYDSTFGLCKDIIEKYLAENEKLDVAIGKLQNTVGDLRKYNKESEQNETDTNPIIAHLQPKVSFMLEVLRYVSNSNNKEIDNGDKSIIENILRESETVSSKDNPIVICGDIESEFFDEMVQLCNQLKNQNKIGALGEIQKYLHGYRTSDKEGYGYKRLLDRVQENFRGSDIAKVNVFLRYYNKNMTEDLARKINEIYVKKIVDNDILFLGHMENFIIWQKMVELLKKLTTKKMYDKNISDNIISVINDAYGKFSSVSGNNPVNIMKSDESNLFIKMSKYNMFMQNYPHTKNLQQIRLIPSKFYTGSYTTRVYNTIFEKIGSSTEIRGEVIGELLQPEYYGTASDESGEEANIMNIIKNIYEPDFSILKRQQIQKQIGGSKDKLNDIIKKNEQAEKIKSNRDKIGVIGEILALLSDSATDYEGKKNRYNKLVDEYTIEYNHVYSYMRYLILIATNQFFTENYVVYEYMNKGIVEFYKRVIDNMIKDLESGNVTEPHIVLVRKYYYTVIYKLKRFIDTLTKNMSRSDIIDIKAVFSYDKNSENLRNMLILLNYFKPILESYNEMFQNQITIYARLNDIRTEIDYSDKVFVSELEREEVRGVSENPLRSSAESLRSSNIFTRNRDTSKMITVPDRCRPYKEKLQAGAELTDIETKFTEVFDSKNFPENSDISKYMTLETQLAKKKGVCIMTYGYSGTGKTYTLFGSGDREGVLKSTLVNINGLEKVNFRLYEIYGMGLPYSFYWENENKKSRLEDIYHRIFHYNLTNNTQSINVEKDAENNTFNEILPRDFRDFIENKDNYVSINKEHISDVFGNFSNFTEQIDKIRKDKKRIRETPNNPESSRSILVYDFDLYVGSTEAKDSVRFMIVDLPGREELTQTYIEPYIGNEHIRELISHNIQDKTKPYKDANIERIKMIITCMALNPMVLSVFDCGIIFNTFNNDYKGDARNKAELIIKILGNKINNSNDELKNKLKLIFQNNNGKLERTGQPAFGCEKETYQYEGLAGIFIISELIQAADFENIENIYTKIVDRYINDPIKRTIENTNGKYILDLIKGLLETKFKGSKTIDSVISMLKNIGVYGEENKNVSDQNMQQNILNIISQNEEEILKNIQKIKEDLYELVKYDYILTPFEGIYINENIIGLIKFLSSKLIKSDGKSQQNIEKQPPITVDDQRNIARTLLISKDLVKDKYKKDNISYGAKLIQLLQLQKDKDFLTRYQPLYINKEKEVDNDSIEICWKENKNNNNNIYLDTERLKAQQEQMAKGYAAEKIFNMDKPLITDILEPYIETVSKSESQLGSESIKKIKDYKIFYLFGNYDDDEKTQYKCEHQIKLLKNTENFIRAIV